MNRVQLNLRRRRSQLESKSRRGAVVTECALLLPFVLLLAFATLEICSALYVRQTIKTIAFEGARVGVKRRATRLDSEQICQQLLIDRGVKNGQVSVTPSDFSKLAALQPISVTVSAPLAGNSWFVNQFLTGGQITATVQMVREYDD